jgi:lipid-A-disaccharide synthase-like uncharacterized protein
MKSISSFIVNHNFSNSANGLATLHLEVQAQAIHFQVNICFNSNDNIVAIFENQLFNEVKRLGFVFKFLFTSSRYSCIHFIKSQSIFTSTIHNFFKYASALSINIFLLFAIKTRALSLNLYIHSCIDVFIHDNSKFLIVFLSNSTYHSLYIFCTSHIC